MGGNNTSGELGLGHNGNTYTFTKVKNIVGNILQVIGGDSYAFLLTDKGLWVCGDNMGGQLGLGDKYPTQFIYES